MYASYVDHNEKKVMVGGSFNRQFVIQEGMQQECVEERKSWSTQNIL
jgi:hypothetical protein